MPSCSDLFTLLFRRRATKWAEKQQMQCPGDPDTAQKGQNNSSVSPNTLNTGHGTNSKESAPKSSLAPPPASSSVVQTSGSAGASKPVEGLGIDAYGGQPSMHNPDEVTTIGIPVDEIALYQESASYSDSEAQETGYNMTKTPGIDVSSLMSNAAEEEKLERETMLNLEEEVESQIVPKGDGESRDDDESKSALALNMETPFSQPLITEGLTVVGEPSNCTSRRQEEPGLAESLDRLLTMKAMGSELDTTAFISGLADICHDPNTAVTVYELVLEDTAMSLTQFLLILAQNRLSLYENSGKPDHINQSIDFIEASKDAAGSEEGELLGIYNIEAQLYHRRFERFGQLNDIEAAISTWELAMERVGVGEDHLKAVFLNNLGNTLLTRYHRLGDMADLNKAILTQEQAVDLTPDEHPDKISWLNNLGNSLRARFRCLGNTADIDKAVLIQQEAVDLTPDGHPDMPSWLNNLGISLRKRYQHQGDMADLEKAISIQQDAVNLTPEGHPNKLSRLSNLGLSLGARFERLGEMADLDKAILTQQQVTDLTPHGHPDRPSRLNNLGHSLRIRFLRLGNTADLDKSVLLQQEAVDLTPDGHPEKPSLLNDLGNALGARFERLGEMADLDKAVLTQQEAVDLTPDEHPSKPARLNDLGVSMFTLFQRLGDVADLDKAILIHQQAVDLTPDQHPKKISRLNNLGVSLFTRFRLLGEMADLNKAVLIQQKAVDLTPDGHPDRPSVLSNQGNLLVILFERLKNIADLNNALLIQQEAVDLTPAGHPDKPSRLSNLGNCLQTRFLHLKEMNDLDQAVLIQQEAINLTPDGHPEIPPMLTNLGSYLGTRFEQLGKRADLDKAIIAQQQAVALMIEGHPDKVSWLHNLAISLHKRFLLLRATEDHCSLVSSLHTAANYPSGPPSLRFKAAHALANLLHPQLESYQTAISLIPQVVWLGRTIGQRYKDLETLGEVVLEAVSAACTEGAYDLALEWIEQGQAIIWGQILQLRSPMDNLRAVHPHLANELHSIASALETAGTASNKYGENALTPEETAQEHRRLAKRWENTLSMVRALPDFGDFLKPKSASALKNAAAHKMIVLVNVSGHRSDALILQPGSSTIAHVHLSTLSATKVNGARDKMVKFLCHSGVRDRDIDRGSTQKGASQGVMLNILQMLWVDVAKPIVDHLGCTTSQPTGNLPHITWCLTGALAILPLHAAGIYSSTSGHDKLHNYVVSSYTPSLTSLIEGMERTPKTPSARSLLAITQQSTPNLPALPATIRELAQVRAQIEKHGIGLTRMDGDQATVQSVSEAMNTHGWVHFACHAKQDAAEPTKSAFSLHDGTLELAEIMKKPLKHAEMAYLSACQTASGHAELPNEAIHLAAGMFIAGYRSVVATLWSMKDRDGPIVAEVFYDRLLSNPDGGVARALYEAVAVLREQVGEKDILAWVPYIHIGH